MTTGLDLPPDTGCSSWRSPLLHNQGSNLLGLLRSPVVSPISHTCFKGTLRDFTWMRFHFCLKSSASRLGQRMASPLITL